MGHLMVDRRRLVGAFTCALFAFSFDVKAQRPERVWRIGYLAQGTAALDRPYTQALRQGLRDLGWIEGQNIQIDERFADGKTERLPALAAELVRAKVDVVVTWSTPAALAAKHATATIPIVIGFAADPVATGIVTNLAHPGGNITGWTHIGLELRAKYLELLKDAVPEAVRVGVLWNPKNQVHKPSLKVIDTAAQRLSVQIHLAGVQDANELEAAFSTFVAERVQALIVFPDGMFIAQMPLILSLAARSRLPALYGVREYVEAGGLMFYGADLSAMQRYVGASIVDKILKGSHPADLPVEQPTKFELVINLNTAKSLGLTIPQSVLLRADEVIQ
ncbi:MAG TPA: ABC transporter substrate-binding protein [Casimicrobiaceae bacterium]|jgi:putative ABC transport system substrate-binding protein